MPQINQNKLGSIFNNLVQKLTDRGQIGIRSLIIIMYNVKIFSKRYFGQLHCRAREQIKMKKFSLTCTLALCVCA